MLFMRPFPVLFYAENVYKPTFGLPFTTYIVNAIPLSSGTLRGNGEQQGPGCRLASNGTLPWHQATTYKETKIINRRLELVTHKLFPS